MPVTKIRRPILAVLALTALFLTLAQVPASAQTTAPTRASYEAYEAEFVRALSTCEERTARGTLADLRACVYDLAAPDPGNAQGLDLWRIFMDCLGLMADSGPDAMYPTTYYEDKVNECLGL